MIVSIPLVDGTYPVVLVGSPLKPAITTSVVATLVAVAVTTEAQVPDEIELVPKLAVPLAMVWVSVTPPEGIVVPFTLVVLDSAAGKSAATMARKEGLPELPLGAA